MRFALITLLLSSSGLLLAQNRPQMTWQGYVSGSVTLYIQNDRVDAQGRDTGAIDRMEYKFFASLPAIQQTVSMKVQRGRGHVQIEEQPVPENEYSTVVRIDPPPGNKPEYYILNFYWDAQPARNRVGPKPSPQSKLRP